MTFDFKHLINIETYIGFSSFEKVYVDKGWFTLVTSEHDHNTLKSPHWLRNEWWSYFVLYYFAKIEVTMGANITKNEKVT